MLAALAFGIIGGVFAISCVALIVIIAAAIFDKSEK